MEKSRKKLEINQTVNREKQKSAKRQRDTIVELTTAALVTALFCVLAPFTIYLPFSPVGITLGSLLLYLTGLVLGAKYGCVSIFLYLCLGFLGIPVFSGYTAGGGVLLGPTGGFLLGYLPCVAVTGSLMNGAPVGKRGVVRFLLAMLAGTGVMYLFGTVWFFAVYTKGSSFWDALMTCVIPLLPADAVKIGLAAALCKPFMRLKYRHINNI